MKTCVLIDLCLVLTIPSYAMTLTNLKTSWQTNPIGLDEEKPTFSWVIDAQEEQIAKQLWYHIIVADDNGRVTWDTGEIHSSQTIVIPYGGSPLEPSTRYNWRLTAKAGNSVATASSFFETGLRDNGWGDALWISATTNSSDRACPVFRKAFSLERPLKKARLYTTSLGIHDIHLNGQRVADTEFKPGCTLYDKTVFYVTHDVTHLLQKGMNALAAQVAAGWWSGPISTDMYGCWPALAFCAKLLLVYEDGTEDILVTDSTWRTSLHTALTLGDIYDGEDYDARLYQPYSSPTFDDSDWLESIINRDFHGTIKAWQGPYVRNRNDIVSLPQIAVKIYEGITSSNTDYGELCKVAESTGRFPLILKMGQRMVVDVGQNITGWVHFHVKGTRGATLTLRFGEMLNDNGSNSRGNDGPGGSVYVRNLREARATLNYTLAGHTEGEEYQPWSTWFGFRYCELTATDDVTILSLVPQVVGTDVEEHGRIVTDNKSVNQLFQNQLWGQRGNFLSIPMDCPQRNERSGWTADAHLFSATAMYNADCYAFYRKWLADLRDSQRETGAFPDVAPLAANRGHQQSNGGWGDAGVILPWNLYMMYGDRQILEENYPSMKRYMDYLAQQVGDGFLYNGAGTAYGDWCAYVPTDNRYVSVCYYAYDALLMSRMAQALSKTEGDAYNVDALKYKQLFANIKMEFASRYLEDGIPRQQTQTALLLPLHFGLLPGEMSRQATLGALRKAIVDNGCLLNTGFLGTSMLCQTLSENGADDLAYALLFQHGNPSWLYSIDQGATTIWERWDSYTLSGGFGDAGMNSFNHYAYGAIGEWMYHYMSGIEPDPAQPGFRHFFLRPHFDLCLPLADDRQHITEVKAKMMSPYGLITSEWFIANGNIFYECDVPVGATATLNIYGQIRELMPGHHRIQLNIPHHPMR